MHRLDRIGVGLLMILAALLPFELTNPIASLGPIVITDVELALYLVLGVWIIAALRTRHIRWTLAHTGVSIWLAAILVTALLAPIDRAAAIKFALRSMGGGLLFFVAADWITSSRRFLWISGALILGTIVSALSGIAEVGLPGAAGPLTAFKTGPSLIGGFVRASGTFQYTNTAAMYWEAALPIVVMFGARLRSDERGRQALIIAAAFTVMLAIVLTASRAALIVTALALMALIAIGHRTRASWRGWPVIHLIGLIAIVAGQLIISPYLALRLQSDNDAAWFRAEYAPTQTALNLDAGQAITLTVAVRNTSVQTWPAAGEQPVRLSYHWIDAARQHTVVFDGVRTPLPHDVAPKDQVTLDARVLAPEQPGDYILQWDMLQERVTWFSTRGQPTADIAAQVVAVTTASAAPVTASYPTIPPALPLQPSRINLWSAGVRIWNENLIAGIGPDNFRHHYGVYLDLGYFDDRITANSWYVETLADMGVIGAGALITLIVTLAITMWRGWKSTTERAMLIGLSIALAAFAVHGAVDYFFEFTPTYGLFWLIAGMMAGVVRNE